MFENLKNMGEYYFIYDTTGKTKEGRDIVLKFITISQKSGWNTKSGKTTVKMESQNLFLLD